MAFSDYVESICPTIVHAIVPGEIPGLVGSAFVYNGLGNIGPQNHVCQCPDLRHLHDFLKSSKLVLHDSKKETVNVYLQIAPKFLLDMCRTQFKEEAKLNSLEGFQDVVRKPAEKIDADPDIDTCEAWTSDIVTDAERNNEHDKKLREEYQKKRRQLGKPPGTEAKGVAKKPRRIRKNKNKGPKKAEHHPQQHPSRTSSAAGSRPPSANGHRGRNHK